MGKGRSSRRATETQKQAMNKTMSGMQPDTQGTAALKSGCEDGQFIYGDLPDEEQDAAQKVDFSVLQHKIEPFTVIEEKSLRVMDFEHLLAYAAELGKSILVCQQEYILVARELANAQEVIMNGMNALFGRSSQRFSAVTGGRNKKKDGKQEEDEAKSADSGPHEEPDAHTADVDSEKEPDAPEGEDEDGETVGKEEKKRPHRSKGCADKVCEDAEENHIDVPVDEAKLDKLFGPGNWKLLKGAESIVKEYQVIPAKMVVNVYHLLKYGAADAEDPSGPEVVTAKSPVIRVRQKSRMSAELLGYLMYCRNSLRMPVSRVCTHCSTMGLNLTAQQLYENLKYYDAYFGILQERQWAELLSYHYLQIDETPVIYYDRSEKKTKRGYMWVFTASEMLNDAKKITLFHFAEGRSAQVLRECLTGFSGVIGSDGHSSYHVFARESEGTVENAGCLDHFRKRVVMALRAIPGLKEMSEEEKLRIPAYVIMKSLAKVFELEREVKKLKTKAEREKYREEEVKDAFDALVKETLGFDERGNMPAGYTADAIRYMKHQEVYLKKFIEDGNIASNNSLCERKFAFFAVLRGQIKMFGSFHGAAVAGRLEGLEQTARPYVKNTRIYYQYLFEQMIPFINKKRKETEDDPIDWENEKYLDRYMPWSKEYIAYEQSVTEKEKVLVPLASSF